MKNFITFLCFVLLIFSCKNNSENISTEINSKSEECISYFEFDEVEYYHNDISKERFFEIAKSKEDSLFFSIMNRRTFSKISDTILIDILPKLGFSKMKILEKDHQELNQLFCIGDSEEITMTAAACDPLYKDILVFRKSTEIIGIAKICFSCNQSLIINQKNQVLPFYSDENWKELNNLLKKYR